MTENVDIDVESGRASHTHVPPLPAAWDDARHIVRHQLSEHGGRLDAYGVELGRLHNEQQQLHGLLSHNNNMLKHVSALVADLSSRANQVSSVIGMLAFGTLVSVALGMLILWRIWH